MSLYPFSDRQLRRASTKTDAGRPANRRHTHPETHARPHRASSESPSNAETHARTHGARSSKVARTSKRVNFNPAVRACVNPTLAIPAQTSDLAYSQISEYTQVMTCFVEQSCGAQMLLVKAHTYSHGSRRSRQTHRRTGVEAHRIHRKEEESDASTTKNRWATTRTQRQLDVATTKNKTEDEGRGTVCFTTSWRCRRCCLLLASLEDERSLLRQAAALEALKVVVGHLLRDALLDAD